jgi:hypothetical protein
MIRAAHSIVVPAKAGTHNHRPAFRPLMSATIKGNSHSAHYDRRGVWVPAFAGTTLRQ